MAGVSHGVISAVYLDLIIPVSGVVALSVLRADSYSETIEKKISNKSGIISLHCSKLAWIGINHCNLSHPQN